MYSKALIDLDFPIELVSAASATEKSIRQGHISTLQQWWARRPLAVCRAAIFAALCPSTAAISQSVELTHALNNLIPENISLEEKLVKFTGLLSDWKVATDVEILSLARQLIRLDRQLAPAMIDTFAGGGSFPIEGLRLGLNVFASDLNPVAATALKAAVEYIPAVGKPILEKYLEVASELTSRIDEVTGALYSTPEDMGKRVLAYFWCRTYGCPRCGIEVPLLRNQWLEKGKRSIAVRLMALENAERFEFRCISPATEEERQAASMGTVTGSGAVCPNCGNKASTRILRQMGRSHQLGERLYAKLSMTEEGKRYYEVASVADEALAHSAMLRPIGKRSLNDFPTLEFDLNGIRHTWAVQYGVKSTRDLYLPRQQVALLEVLHELNQAKNKILSNSGNTPISHALIILLSLTFNRLVSYGTKHAWWQPNGGFPASMFTKQAIAMTWNFVEIPVNSVGAAGWGSAVLWITKVIQHLLELPENGRVEQTDAAFTGLAGSSIDLVTIDPPYFDSVAYSYLSDVYYVWMKDYLGDILPSYFKGTSSPKAEEAIVDRTHTLAPTSKSEEHFYRKITQALCEINRVLKPEGRLIIMYGHKSFQAWGVFLKALYDAGFHPTASYPIQTERKIKFQHGRIDSLSSSCLMVCQRRDEKEGGSISWARFEEELLENLMSHLIRFRLAHVEGADLTTALIAPAVGTFNKYKEVILGEKVIDYEWLIEKLPSIVAKCQIEATMLETYLTQSPEATNVLKSLLYDERYVGTDLWLRANGIGSVLDRIAKYVSFLAEGDLKSADTLWDSLARSEQDLAKQYLRAISATNPAGSKSRQLANASLGRISYQARA